MGRYRCRTGLVVVLVFLFVGVCMGLAWRSRKKVGPNKDNWGAEKEVMEWNSLGRQILKSGPLAHFKLRPLRVGNRPVPKLPSEKNILRT